MRGMMIFHRMYKPKTDQFPCYQYQDSLAQPSSLSCILDLYIGSVHLFHSSQYDFLVDCLDLHSLISGEEICLTGS